MADESAEHAGARENQQQGKKRKREKKPLETANEDAEDVGHSRLVRALGSVDWQTREKGLQVLTRWLTHRGGITDGDLNKLWKGLFYSFWHSDKQPVQAALAERLAQILPQLDDDVAYAYFRVFFLTMRREWFGIDRLRLDKFMMLVRMFVRHTFTHLRNCQWEDNEVERFTNFLTDEVLLKQDGQPAVGLVYHLADCYMAELLEVDSQAASPARACATLLAPFVQLLGHIQSSAGIARVLSGVWQPLLVVAALPADAQHSSSFADRVLLTSLAETLFDLGASGEVKARNRAALYNLSQQLQKTARKVASVKHAPGAEVQLNGTPASDPVTVKAAAAPATPSPSGAAAAALSSRKAAKRASRLARVTTAPDGPPASAAADAPTTAASPAAGSSQKKKRKKRKLNPAAATTTPDADAAAASTVTVPVAAAIAAAAEAPLRNGGVAVSTPVTGARPMAASASATARATRRAASGGDSMPGSEQSKSVRFRLKKNLYFEHGGPLPLPELRTPPSAQPKGPALRMKATPGGSSTPSGSSLKPKSLALKAPRSTPRPKAAAFF